MDIYVLLGGVVVSIISYGIIELLKKYVGFQVKAWVIPIAFLIGFILSPYIYKFFESDELEVITGITYDNVTIDISKKEFVRCTFANCKLVYSGEYKTNWTSCIFAGQTYIYFDDAAARNINSLQAFYETGGNIFQSQILEILERTVSPNELLIINQKNDTLSLKEEKIRLQLQQQNLEKMK